MPIRPLMDPLYPSPLAPQPDQKGEEKTEGNAGTWTLSQQQRIKTDRGKWVFFILGHKGGSGSGGQVMG